MKTCTTCGSQYEESCFICSLPGMNVRSANVTAAPLKTNGAAPNFTPLDPETAIRQAEHEAAALVPQTEECFHTCPDCSETYSHDIPETVCKVPKRSRCTTCTEKMNSPASLEQDLAEIQRPTNLEGIRQGQLLNNREITELLMQYEAFVVLNLVNDETGAERTNKIELIENHILDIKRKIEAYRVMETAARRVKGKIEIEDLGKLSPEEREAYKTAARKRTSGVAVKKVSADSADRKKLTKEMKMAEKLLKQFGPSAVKMVCETFGITEAQAKELL